MTETTEELIPNIPRMRKELAWLEEQAALPESERVHDQRMWIHDDQLRTAADNREEFKGIVEWHCGVKACLCGHMAIDEGATITVKPFGLSSVPFVEVLFDGLSPEEYGRRLLGISADEADALFDGDITVPEQRKLMEAIAGEPL